MVRRTYSLRERGEALYAAGQDWGGDIVDACNIADQWGDADAVIVAIGEKFGIPDSDDMTAHYDRVQGAVDELVAKVARLEREAKRHDDALAVKDAEIDRLRQAMQRAGVAPPPPVDALAFRPSVPVARSYTGRTTWPPLEDDDIPF